MVGARTLQANAGTLLDRTSRWTFASCRGTPDLLGGAAVDRLVSKIPIKVMVTCVLLALGPSFLELLRHAPNIDKSYPIVWPLARAAQNIIVSLLLLFILLG